MDRSQRVRHHRRDVDGSLPARPLRPPGHLVGREDGTVLEVKAAKDKKATDEAQLYLFDVFGKEDRQMAELGMDEYAENLKREDDDFAILQNGEENG